METVRKAETFPAELKAPAKKLFGDALIRVGKREEGCREYIEYLRAYPKAPTVASGLMYVVIAQQLLYAEKPAEAEKILNEAFKLGEKLEYHPHIIDFMYKCYTALGKLQEAEALWLKWGPEFEKRGAVATYPDTQRNNYRTFSEWYLFRLGYVNFALGQFDQAKDYFRRHLEKYSGKKALNPATTVFLQRSTKLLDVLEKQIGKEAPPIDLQGLWAWNKSFSLEKHAGKVVALCFRTYGSSRVYDCLKYLQRTYEKHGEDDGPLMVASIAFLKGTKDVPGQLLQVEEEARALGLTFPCGLDPTPRREIFTRLYRANVGSATLIIIDPLGQIVYYEQDPRPNAFGLFDKIIHRLMGR
jgi:tetratricopeptide (TPR) repeat protein